MRTGLVALFLVVFGSKALLLSTFGSAVPYWDQWDAEAVRLYLPYLNGTLSFWSLFASHNEHRVFFTRVLCLLLFEGAGEWDPVLQMLVNAGLHALFVAALTYVLLPLVNPSRRLPVTLFAALVFVLPIGWENTFTGFYSQFYLLLIFSLAATIGFARADAFSPLWFMSLAACAGGYFSMASGALTLFSAMTLVVIQMAVRVRQRTTREVVASAVLGAVGGAMIYGIADVPARGYQAHGVGQFLGALVAIGSVPFATVAGVAFVHFPLVWFAVSLFRAPVERRDRRWIVLGLAGWLAAQLVAIAYGRAAGVTASRYLDVAIIAFPLNLVALVSLVDSLAGRDDVRRRLRALRSVWVVAMVVVIFAYGYYSSWRGVVKRGQQVVEQRQNVTAYLATGDIGNLTGKPFQSIPYPRPEELAEFLSNPAIRSFLPREIRPAQADVAGMRSRTVLKGRLGGVTRWTRDTILFYSPLLFSTGLALFFLAGLSAGPKTGELEQLNS